MYLDCCERASAARCRHRSAPRSTRQRRRDVERDQPALTAPMPVRKGAVLRSLNLPCHLCCRRRAVCTGCSANHSSTGVSLICSSRESRPLLSERKSRVSVGLNAIPRPVGAAGVSPADQRHWAGRPQLCRSPYHDVACVTLPERADSGSWYARVQHLMRGEMRMSATRDFAARPCNGSRHVLSDARSRHGFSRKCTAMHRSARASTVAPLRVRARTLALARHIKPIGPADVPVRSIV